ncbi:MAG: hypothetical protein RLW68_17285 [Devosia marina]|uniref:hypothetical protein n=1 Tax=Devosia marina TaxID=2683198 RepID=UPI0032EF3FFC
MAQKIINDQGEEIADTVAWLKCEGVNERTSSEVRRMAHFRLYRNAPVIWPVVTAAHAQYA